MASSEIDKLERLVRENPKGRQFAILADAYRKDGQLQRSLEVLTSGLDHHPDYVSARVVLGRVHMAMGDKPKAREAFARVISLDPESVIALKALADLAEEEGESSEALRWSGQLLAVDPGNEEAIKQTERLAAAAPAEAAPAEPRLSGIVPMEMDAPAEEPAAAPPEAPVKTVEIQAPVKTVELTIPAAPMISVQNLAPRFSAAAEPLAQEPEPLPLSAPLSDEAQTEKTAQMVRPMEALEPTSYEGPADTGTERLAGMDPTGMSESEIAGIGAASGFEPTSGPLDTREIAAVPLAGLDRPGDDVGAGDGADVVGLEREQDLDLGAAASNEFQESSTAETLRRASGANEFQDDSVAETLQRRSGANEFQAPDDGGLVFIDPPAASAPPQAPIFTPAPLPVEDLEPAVAEPEPVVTEAMAELYASQGHLVAALEVYHELAMRNPDDPRYADRIVELEMFVGGTESVSAVQTFEPADLPVAEEDGEASLDISPMPVDMIDEPPAAPVAESIAAMELTEGGEAAAAGRGWHADATGGTPVRSWLADLFAEALPIAEPKAPRMSEPAPAVPEAAPESDVTPRGAPTRPASGSFSLNNVFGEGGAAPAPKSGSFDDFFGAPPSNASSAPAEPGAPSIRSRPSTATPGAEDDLSSFQDWLKGLKK